MSRQMTAITDKLFRPCVAVVKHAITAQSFIVVRIFFALCSQS